MIVYLVRHANSTSRRNMNYIESEHVKLSKIGKLQAFILAKKLKKLGIKKIISSPIIRAQETANTIKKVTGLDVEFNDAFKEHSPSRTLKGEEFKLAKAKTREDHNFIPKDGESLNQSVERFVSGMQSIKQYEIYDTVCIVSHALIIQNFLIKLFKLDYVPVIDEVSITAIEYANGKFKLLYINKPPSVLVTILRIIINKTKLNTLWN